MIKFVFEIEVLFCRYEWVVGEFVVHLMLVYLFIENHHQPKTIAAAEMVIIKP